MALIAALFAVTPGQAGISATSAPKGLWLWNDGRAAVEFHMCGEALCGRVVWLRADDGAHARPTVDARNPDQALRGRRICGLDYITRLEPSARGEWKKGRIYDFTTGSTYDLDIDYIGDSQVKMRGYQVVRAMGETLTLVRPKSRITVCETAAATG